MAATCSANLDLKILFHGDRNFDLMQCYSGPKRQMALSFAATASAGCASVTDGQARFFCYVERDGTTARKSLILSDLQVQKC